MFTLETPSWYKLFLNQIPSLPGWLNRLRHRHCSTAAVAGLSSTRGGRLVADARDQQPFEPGKWGLESCSLRPFLREPPCRTCKKHPAGIWLQDYGCGSPDQNKCQTAFLLYIWARIFVSSKKILKLLNSQKSKEILQRCESLYDFGFYLFSTTKYSTFIPP